MRMNKKAEEEVYSVLWILAIVIIAGAIVAGVWIFMSSSVNISSMEADSLSNLAVHCLIDNGNLRSDFFSEFDIYSGCNIDKKVFETGNKFYLSIEVSGSDDSIIKTIEIGMRDFKNQCFMKGGEAILADCSTKTIYGLNESDASQVFTIKIIGASTNGV